MNLKIRRAVDDDNYIANFAASCASGLVWKYDSFFQRKSELLCCGRGTPQVTQKLTHEQNQAVKCPRHTSSVGESRFP